MLYLVSTSVTIHDLWLSQFSNNLGSNITCLCDWRVAWDRGCPNPETTFEAGLCVNRRGCCPRPISGPWDYHATHVRSRSRQVDEAASTARPSSLLATRSQAGDLRAWFDTVQPLIVADHWVEHCSGGAFFFDIPTWTTHVNRTFFNRCCWLMHILALLVVVILSLHYLQ